MSLNAWLVASLGGGYFIESKLEFGCQTSPFFYNEVARMLIMIPWLDVRMDSRLSLQQLDDNAVAGRKGSLEVLQAIPGDRGS